LIANRGGPAKANRNGNQVSATGAWMRVGEVIALSKKRFVIAPDTVQLLASEGATISEGHALVAPTLLRSQALSHLYSAVRKGELERKQGNAQLDHLWTLHIRFRGDLVMQRHAWDIAAKLGLTDTYLAEYIAATHLQADALVTSDSTLIRVARPFVSIATIGGTFGQSAG
jgi:predicted nucleic acid-binding protein